MAVSLYGTYFEVDTVDFGEPSNTDPTQKKPYSKDLQFMGSLHLHPKTLSCPIVGTSETLLANDVCFRSL